MFHGGTDPLVRKAKHPLAQGTCTLQTAVVPESFVRCNFKRKQITNFRFTSAVAREAVIDSFSHQLCSPSTRLLKPPNQAAHNSCSQKKVLSCRHVATQSVDPCVGSIKSISIVGSVEVKTRRFNVPPGHKYIVQLRSCSNITHTKSAHGIKAERRPQRLVELEV